MGQTTRLVGLTLESIAYGTYSAIFAAYLIQFKRPKRGPNLKAVVFYLHTALFTLCTAYVSLEVTSYWLLSQSILAPRLQLSQDALYIFIDLISQVILMDRCWIMWRRPYVMVVPILLSLGFLAISLTSLGGSALFPGVYTPQNTGPSWDYPVVLSFSAISLSVNALLTGLIVFKILGVYRESQELKRCASYVDSPRRDLDPITPILIESGVITFVAQLVQILMYKFTPVAFQLVAGLIVMLYGLSSMTILMHLEMGSAYDESEEIKTAMRFSASANYTDATTTMSRN